MNNDENFFLRFNNPQYVWSYTTFNPNVSYTINTNTGSVTFGPDLNAIIEKADREFDALEDQTSVAKQMLNDIGITWNDKE